MGRAETLRDEWPRAAGALVAFVAVTLAAGALGGIVTDPGWYQSLARPSWAPPPWLFGPVWTTLYVLMALAAFWVWYAKGFGGARTALTLYGLQLVLNAAWTPVFFGLREPAWALIVLVALWIAIAATIVAFARIRKGAAWLLVPYLAWVSFAGALNLQLVRLN